MSTGAEPMECSRCGAQMNRHAEKLREPTTPEEARAANPALQGLREEMFACPSCGWCDSRRAD